MSCPGWTRQADEKSRAHGRGSFDHLFAQVAAGGVS